MVLVEVDILISAHFRLVYRGIEREREVRLSFNKNIKESNLVIGLFLASECDDILTKIVEVGQERC
jgi:hypothetical protein